MMITHIGSTKRNPNPKRERRAIGFAIVDFRLSIGRVASVIVMVTTLSVRAGEVISRAWTIQNVVQPTFIEAISRPETIQNILEPTFSEAISRAYTGCNVGILVPDDDEDSDSIPDCADNCPLPNPDQADCQQNGIGDVCEIADCTVNPACGDCNGNAVPDECDIAACGGDPACGDCNSNLIPDGCELAACAPGEFACQDCNHNGMLDSCDIASGAEDLDGNGVPDECYPAVSAQAPDKTRFVSFTIPGGPPAPETAIRVKLVSLHHVVPPYTGGPSIPFASFEGQTRWVGPPTSYMESTSVGQFFFASQLQCNPHYRDWSTVGLLHVTGSAIVPNSIYDVENVSSVCTGAESACLAVSAPLQIATTRWGDVEVPYNPPSTTTQPDLGDVASLVNKFKSAPGAPIKARALLAGDDAFGNISPLTLSLDLGFGHIAACVDAFKGKPYPHTIQACP